VLVRVGQQVHEVPRTLIGRAFVRTLTRLLLVVIVGGGALVGYVAYRIWDQGGRDEQQPADAIVVMGAAQYDGRPSPLFAARLDHAIELYLAGVADRLIVTGGKQEGDRTNEAASARAYAIGHGVPAEAILAEDQSRTTLQSIRGVARLMADGGLESAVFVSDPSHMLRVLRMAGDAGIAAYGSPTRTSPLEREPFARLDAIIHELGALGLYFVTGDSP
jgi:uncharacterized SAM-binding protein YcdF (DUF218 family)